MEHDRKPEEAPDISFYNSPPRKRLDGSHDFNNYYDDDIDEDGYPGDLLRRRALERNRIAAKKFRVRKREEASALASRKQALEDQNRYLYTHYKFLSTEIYLLKFELLRHINCDCTLIQEYITNEARRSMDKLNVSPLAMYPHSETTPNNPGNQMRRTSCLDAVATALDGYNPLGDFTAEPNSNRWANTLPNDITMTSNLAYLYRSSNIAIHNCRYDNLPRNVHDELHYDTTGTHP